MNCSIVSMLEAIKLGTFTDVDAYMKEKEKISLITWFEQYSLAGEISLDISTVINLMYELYVRENIDFYPVEEYQRVTTELASRYHFDRTRFLEILQSFRRLVYGEM